MNLDQLEPDAQLLRQTFGLFPSAVACIGAIVDAEREALVASSFTVGVSMDPPLVSFAVQNHTRTWPRIKQGTRIGVSLMATEHADVCRRIASRDRESRFDGVETHDAESGALYLTGAPVWLQCSIYSEVPAGDHHLVLLQVEHLGFNPALSPLIFHQSAFTSVR